MKTLKLFLSIMLFSASQAWGAVPTFSGFTPLSGAPGTTVTITGTNFNNPDVTSVKFGTTEASSFTIVNATTITAVVATGTVSAVISATNTSGTVYSTVKFSVLGYSGGNGVSAATAYLLSTPNDVVSFSNNVDALIDQSSFFKLTGDIDMTGVDWSYGIGRVPARLFQGTFDGSGHKILNLTGSPANQTGYGLFGFVDGATIKNLELKDVNFNATLTGVSLSVGGLIAQPNGNTVTIDNCKVSGIINATSSGTASTAKYLRCGGLVGACAAGSLNITNSSCNVQLTGNNIATGGSAWSSDCGGIVGTVPGSATSLNIVNCFSNGSVVSTSTLGSPTAGGVIGLLACSQTKIYNCYSTVSVDALASAKTGTNSSVGGIVGTVNSASAEIKNCIALNTHIYGRNGLTTVVSPNLGRICGNKGSNGVFAENQSFIGTDGVKGWSGWSGDIATGTFTQAYSPNQTIDDTGKDGAKLSTSAGAALILLNSYVSAHPTSNGISLSMWVANTDGNPVFSNTLSGIDKLSMQNTLKYSVINSILKLSSIEGTRNLRIYSILGTEMINEMVTTGYSTQLKSGIYLLNLQGYTPVKIIIN